MNADLSIAVLATPDLDPRDIQELCRLKAQHWPYPLAQQIDWFERNVAPADSHALGRIDGALVAYTRLVRCTVHDRSSGRASQVAGVSTVCIDTALRGRGVGRRFMTGVGDWIAASGVPGLLMCAPALETFYGACGWVRFDGTLDGAFADAALRSGSIVMVHEAAGNMPRVAGLDGPPF